MTSRELARCLNPVIGMDDVDWERENEYFKIKGILKVILISS